MDHNNLYSPYFNKYSNCHQPQMDPNTPNCPNTPVKPFVNFNFANWHKQGPNCNQPTPTPEIISEFVPETQPQTQSEAQPIIEPKPTLTSKRNHKKREVAEKNTKPSMTKWSEEEEVALARAYIDTSEDPSIGRNHTSDFWNRVRGHFFAAMGRGHYRTNDMISSKWRDMQAKVLKFVVIWNEHNNKRKSGHNDEMVTSDALMQYTREKSTFTHLEAWRVMRNSTKWLPVPKLQISKRSKTNSSTDVGSGRSSSRLHSHLNDLDDEGEEYSVPLEPSWPPNQNNGEKHPITSASSEFKESLDKILTHIKIFVDIQEEKRYNNDMKLLWTPTDHLTGHAREHAKKTKEGIRKKWNMEL